MTTRSLHSGLAGIALVLQVLMGVGPASGFVLCIGSDGHVAFEDHDAAARCRALGTPFGSGTDTGFSASAVPACTDTPLLVAASERETPFRVTPTAGIALPVVASPVPALHYTRTSSRTEPPLAHARLMRSIVLRI